MEKRLLGKSAAIAVLAAIISLTLVTGCSSKGGSVESTGSSAAAETTGAAATVNDGKDVTATESEEAISKEELQAISESAVPYDGEIQAILHSSSGEEVVLNSPKDNKEVMAALSALAGKRSSWIKVKSASATSTLKIDGYSYNVWNMLDWDTTTCWAEGEPRSEGLWEGFSYYFNGNKRIDGFRIYPGYQKNKRVYRNNIYPRGLIVYAGGYEITCDLDNWIQNINRDGDYYWIDITFSSPVYDYEMYTMITAVGTYGDDPDSDCCITEFHPFNY